MKWRRCCCLWTNERRVQKLWCASLSRRAQSWKPTHKSGVLQLLPRRQANIGTHTFASRSTADFARVAHSGHFQSQSVRYNNALRMGSVHANLEQRGEGNSSFNPTVTVQGRIHHYIGGLQPSPGRSPAFLAMYIFDTDLDLQSNI